MKERIGELENDLKTSKKVGSEKDQEIKTLQMKLQKAGQDQGNKTSFQSQGISDMKALNELEASLKFKES